MSPSERTNKALAATAAELHAVLEACVDGIVIIDEQGIIRTFNPAAQRMFGYAEEEVVGQNVKVLMPSPYREEHDGYIARYLATGQKRIIGIGREAMGRRKDGTIFPVDLSVAEAWLGDKRIFVGIIRDITERKRAEEELRQNHDRLRKLVAELQAKNEEVRLVTQQLWLAAKLASVGELAASIAHELNNPLAIVTLRIESLLEQVPEGDPKRNALEIVAQETKRMSNLVANLLQFSRHRREEISTVDIRQEVIQAVELVQHHLRKRQIAVVQELAADTPIIYADRQKLRQVFLNLLTNASDAIPEGGTLTLRSRPDTLEGGEAAVRIEVADTGVGIPAAHLEKVFDPFFTTKEEGQGTGLGLAICRRVVEEHHGTIRIDSEVGKGTTLILVLPVRNGTNGDRVRGVCPPHPTLSPTLGERVG
ncbi:MAG TPA: PAS domain S-box protein [Gemmataceae bacterium]|nr:PAS domain S-box protein [Gemmataceae bacterium]